MTPYYELDPNEMDPGSGAQEAAYLLQKIDVCEGLADFLEWGGPGAFPDNDLHYLAIDACEAMKALNDGLTAWARARGVSR